MENLVGAILFFSIIGAGIWVIQQRNHFDPSERDLPLEYLKASKIQNIHKKAPIHWGQTSSGMAQTENLGILDETLLQGWSVAKPMKSFAPDKLYIKINGQAEQYLRFDCQELQVFALQNALGQSMDLFVYDQNNVAGSLGLYAEQRSPEHEVIQRKKVNFTPTSVGAFGIIGPYFFQCIVTGQPAEVITARDHVIKTLNLMELQSDQQDLALEKLLNAGANLKNVSYVPKNAFQYGFASEFWFLSIPHSEAQWFIHHASEPSQALAMLEQFKQALPEDYEPLPSSEEVLYFKHPFLKTVFAITVKDQWIMGIEGAPSPSQAQKAMASFLSPEVNLSSPSTSTLEVTPTPPAKDHEPEEY